MSITCFKIIDRPSSKPNVCKTIKTLMTKMCELVN